MWRATGCHLGCHVELLDVKNGNNVNGIQISQGSFQENSDVFIHSINIHWAPCLSGLLSYMWQNPTLKWHFWNKTIGLQNWWSRGWQIRLSWVQGPKSFIKTWSLHPLCWLRAQAEPSPTTRGAVDFHIMLYFITLSPTAIKKGVPLPQWHLEKSSEVGGQLS